MVEIARISINDGFPYIFTVHGGDTYIHDMEKLNKPHFYFYNEDFNLMISIPTINERILNKELYLLNRKNWKVLEKEYIELILWLDADNNMLPLYSNLEIIRIQWNLLNYFNDGVKQLDIIK